MNQKGRLLQFLINIKSLENILIFVMHNVAFANFWEVHFNLFLPQWHSTTRRPVPRWTCISQSSGTMVVRATCWSQSLCGKVNCCCGWSPCVAMHTSTVDGHFGVCNIFEKSLGDGTAVQYIVGGATEEELYKVTLHSSSSWHFRSFPT